MNNILTDAINYYDNESIKFKKLLLKLCSKLKLTIQKDKTNDSIVKKLYTNGNIFFDFYNYSPLDIMSVTDQQVNMGPKLTITFGTETKIYIKCKFFYLAVITNDHWYWYWITKYNKNTIYKSQKILRYGLDINVDPSENEYPINLITRGLLINGKIQISNKTNQILLLKALSLYITNSNAIIELKVSDSDEISILILYDIEDQIEE